MLFTPRKTVVLFMLLLVLISTVWAYRQLELPAPGGRYQVGVTAIKWLDSSRPEVLSEDPEDVREVVALVWYPAEPETGVQAGYFTNLASVSAELVNSGEVTKWAAFGLRFVRSHVFLDAIPLRNGEPFPVVLLSPGNGTNIEFYSSLGSEIASHGYIVIGINHPHDSAAVELSDGEVAPYDKEQWSLEPRAHRAYVEERMKVRTADVLFALEQLDEMNSTGPFAGTMNLDAVAAAGHSLGGITASEACKADARFRACLNLDGLQAGGPFSMDEDGLPPEQPFMFLTKETQLHPRILERFEAMPESYWVIVHGASHQSFTDGPLLQSALLPGSNQAERLMELTQKYSVAFLDQTLKGQASSLASNSPGPEEVSIRVFSSR